MHPSYTYGVAALAIGILLAACGGSAGDDPAPSATGDWAQSPTVVGSSLVLHLASADPALSGSGTYTMEAGPSGTLSIRGSYVAPQVHLVLNFDRGGEEDFTGTLSADGRMTGTLTTAGGLSFNISFIRR